MRLAPRPDMAQLAVQDPELLEAVRQLTTVDALVYSAALAAFLGRWGGHGCGSVT